MQCLLHCLRSRNQNVTWSQSSSLFPPAMRGEKGTARCTRIGYFPQSARALILCVPFCTCYCLCSEMIDSDQNGQMTNMAFAYSFPENTICGFKVCLLHSCELNTGFGNWPCMYSSLGVVFFSSLNLMKRISKGQHV